MADYPEYLIEQDYYNSILGGPADDPRINDLRYYVGTNKPVVAHTALGWEDHPDWWTWVNPPRDFGDGAADDPEQNWDEDNF